MKTYLFAAAFVTIAVGCGTDKKSTTPTGGGGTGTAATWADVQPIVTKSCATANCHVKGGKGTGDYSAISESAFKATDSKARISLPATTQGVMPDKGSKEQAAWTDADKQKMLSFFGG